MAQPLAMLVYDKVLPGTQLGTRLEDRGYRVLSLNDLETLVEQAEREKPMFAVVDFGIKAAAACAAIAKLRQHGPTAHLPVIALTSPSDTNAQESARAAGATLVVHDSIILAHLDQFIEQALEL
jgi:CheY-like chemotaxis protein